MDRTKGQWERKLPASTWGCSGVQAHLSATGKQIWLEPGDRPTAEPSPAPPAAAAAAAATLLF